MKYYRLRDTRPSGGFRMSVSIDAASKEEADAIFEERFAARAALNAERATLNAQPSTKPVPDYLSPAAMQLKKDTPMFTSGL